MPVPPGSTKARKPTHLKILKGSFRASRGNALEPKLPAEIPAPPERLDAEEKEAWTYYAELLGPLRIVTRQDAIAFERLVCCHVEVMRAQAVIRKQATEEKDTDPTYETVGQNGQRMLRVKPIFAALTEAERRLRDWLGRFGLTPADRSRVQTGDNGKGKKRKEDEFA
jgi:P27 family predicted phage terminase small subunit